MSVKTSPGCAITVLILIGIFCLYTYNISNPAEAKKERAELNKKWGEKTVNYFLDYSCSDLDYEEANHQIEKFFVLESHLDHPCNLSVFSRTDLIFNNEESLKDLYSKNIHEVNTIIWVKSVPGSIEGEYNDGSKAYRLVAEIHFIKKSTNKIYKTKSLEFTGDPKGSIERQGNKSKGENVYFGEKPYNQIFGIILNEINAKNTMAKND